MVSGLPKTRRGSDEDRTALAATASALAGVQQQLTEAIDLDTEAYDQVVAAYKMPKGSPADQDARKVAIQRALKSATDVPLGVMRLSAMALRQAQTVAAHGHRAAASDVGVGLALLAAGSRGARLNVEINLGSLADAAYADAVRVEVARLSEHTALAIGEAQELLQG
jgi:formiminotetrahydrofolate cyclodeaminase